MLVLSDCLIMAGTSLQPPISLFLWVISPVSNNKHSLSTVFLVQEFVCLCVCTYAHGPCGAHVEVRGQVVWFGSLLSTMWLLRWIHAVSPVNRCPCPLSHLAGPFLQFPLELNSSVFPCFLRWNISCLVSDPPFLLFYTCSDINIPGVILSLHPTTLIDGIFIII